MCVILKKNMEFVEYPFLLLTTCPTVEKKEDYILLSGSLCGECGSGRPFFKRNAESVVSLRVGGFPVSLRYDSKRCLVEVRYCGKDGKRRNVCAKQVGVMKGGRGAMLTFDSFLEDGLPKERKEERRRSLQDEWERYKNSYLLPVVPSPTLVGESDDELRTTLASPSPERSTQ